jgi:hypothetical protein
MARPKKAVLPNKNEDFGKKLDKHYSGRANSKIDEAGKWGKGKINQGVGKAESALIERGVNKDIVKHGGKIIRKESGKLIGEAAGAAKRWIHTEGKNTLKEAGRKVAEGARELGRKAKSKWDEFKGRLKRR